MPLFRELSNVRVTLCLEKIWEFKGVVSKVFKNIIFFKFGQLDATLCKLLFLTQTHKNNTRPGVLEKMSPHSVPGYHPPSQGCSWFLCKERGAGHHILSSFHGPSNTGQSEINVFTLIKVLNVIHLHFMVFFNFPDALNAAQRFDSLPTWSLFL